MIKNYIKRVYYFFIKLYYFFFLKNYFNYEKNFYDRKAFINLCLLFYGNKAKYLEIGVFKNAVFNTIPLTLENKVGVDPVKGGTHRLDSDNFFRQHNKEIFDLIFIDGLHLYEQIKKDFINSYNSLSSNGLILLHDLLPLNHITQSRLRKSSVWNGDVWKFALELSRLFKDDFIIVNIDYGIGVFKKNKKQNINQLTWSQHDLSQYDIKKFMKYEVKNLKILSCFDAIQFIQNHFLDDTK